MKPAIRTGIVLALALPASLLLIDSVLGQPGPRGSRPRLPGSNIGGGPSVMPPMGGPRIGGIGGTVTVWTCPNCKREVGRGNTPPATVTCCGQTYVNGKSLGFGSPPPSTAAATGSTNPAPEAPPPAPVITEPVVAASPPPVAPSTSTGSGKMIALGLGVVLIGVLVIGGVIVLVVHSQRSIRPGAKRRRPRRDD